MDRGGHRYDLSSLAVSDVEIPRAGGGAVRVVTFRGPVLRDGRLVRLDPTDGTLHIVNPPEIVVDEAGRRHDPELALMHALLDHIDGVAG